MNPAINSPHTGKEGYHLEKSTAKARIEIIIKIILITLNRRNSLTIQIGVIEVFSILNRFHFAYQYIE